jgi:ActR/RegA family two-component response regulator
MEGIVKMQDTEVLWIDDDISQNGDQIMEKLKDKVRGIKLFTAKSCGESEKILKKLRPRSPQWAIVDLRIPQGGWEHEEYFPTPGINYIKYLKDTYKDNINIYAFSIIVTKDLENELREAGAKEAFVKTNTSFAGILGKIQDERNVKNNNQKQSIDKDFDEKR